MPKVKRMRTYGYQRSRNISVGLKEQRDSLLNPKRKRKESLESSLISNSPAGTDSDFDQFLHRSSAAASNKKRTLRPRGRHRNRRISVTASEQFNNSSEPKLVRKDSASYSPIGEGSFFSSHTAPKADFSWFLSQSSTAASNKKRALHRRGRHRNRRINVTPSEQLNNSSEPELVRKDGTSSSPMEGSFFSSHTAPKDDFSRFLSQSASRKKVTDKEFCALETSSSLESSKVFGSLGSDDVLFCSLRSASNDTAISNSPFPNKPPVQLDMSVSKETEVNNRKVRRKVRRLKAPRIVKKGANIVPPSGVKNNTPQIDWNEIENYSLVIEKEIPRVSEKRCSPVVVSPSSLEKLKNVFCHASVHNKTGNSHIPLFSQTESTNPSPIRSTDPKENYASTVCSAENTPEFSRRLSAAQKIFNIKTSTPFVLSNVCHNRRALREKTSPLSLENSMYKKSTISKITESLAATSKCLNRMLNSSHHTVSDQINSGTPALNQSLIKTVNSPSKSENAIVHSNLKSQAHNSPKGSKLSKESVLASDSVTDISFDSTETSEVPFLQGKAMKEISSVGIRDSCSLNMNKNFRDRFHHVLHPQSRENSFKAGEIDHQSLIANLRKSAHRMSLSYMKKTSEPSTPVSNPSQTSALTKAYKSADWPQVVKPCLIAVTPLKTQAVGPSQKLLCGNDDSEKIECTEEDQVLELCSQEKPIPFSKAFNSKVLKNCKKIGEGVYGEVFRLDHEDGSRTALKLIPVEGDFEVNGETQKTFAEILPEIVITKELSNLSRTFHNSTPNFIKVKKVMCLKGKYPPDLLQEWDRYDSAKGSLNDRPDIYQNKQLFIALECADGGTDLESIQFKNANEAASIFVQVACTLAVAEQAVQFEHRDLHWGNILVSCCKETEIEYTLNGQDFHINSEGVFASVIDFTLSRLGKDGCVVYTDLSQDPTLFTGEGDYQFDIYRLMKDHNKNDWESYMAYSNVLWLHYLIEKLTNEKDYKNKLSKKHKSAKQQLLQWKDMLLQHKSATDFILNSGIVSSKVQFRQNSTDDSEKKINVPHTQQRKPLRERKGSVNVTLEGKAKKNIPPSSVAKLKKTSKFIASKKIVPASRAVRGSARKGKNPIQMTLKAFNVRI